MTIALVTEAAAEHLDDDIPPLEHALAALDLESRRAFWDDPAVDWSSFDLVMIRSPWSYFRQRDAFLVWADRVETQAPLANPADVLRWNTDKRYLADLAAAGLATTPTAFIEPGMAADDFELPAGDIVVKPAVSAGANDTQLHRAPHRDAALEHVRQLVDAGRTAMVQPYLHAVDTLGETALLYFGGRFSHAVRKGPILHGGTVQMVEGLYAAEDISPRQPSAAERALAERTLDAIPGGRNRLLYARVDLLAGAHGEPRVLEVELTEPSVFLAHSAGSAERFAAAVAAALTP